jgi:hypothetical protein
MQIGATPSFVTGSYQQAQPQQGAQAAISALDARQPTQAPVQTEAAVRPAVKAFDSGSSVEDYKKNERQANGASASQNSEARPANQRGQIVDIRA